MLFKNSSFSKNFCYMETSSVKILIYKGSSTKYVGKIIRKTNISYPLIRTRMCAYQGVRNVSFSEIFVYVLTLPAQIDVTPQQLIFWEFSTHSCYFTQRVY